MSGYGIVGLGLLGRRLATRLAGATDAPPLVAVLVRPSRVAEAAALVGADKVCATLESFVARRPSIAVESASAAALAELGPKLMATGVDVIPLSLTAMTDSDIERRLIDAARTGPGRLEIAPGAMGSLDLLATAREEGLERVVYRQLKSVAMWKRTPAAGLADLDSIGERRVFLRGSVREVAKHFPHNLNTSVGVALAGLGLDRTEIELVADPDLRHTAHELDVYAGPGNAAVRVGGREVAPDGDPIDYTTFSLMRLLRRRLSRVAV